MKIFITGSGNLYAEWRADVSVKGIYDFDEVLEMAGVFPFETEMKKEDHLGYRDSIKENCILGKEAIN